MSRLAWEICHSERADYSSKLVKCYPVLSLYAILPLKVGKCVEILSFPSTILNSPNVVPYSWHTEGTVLLLWSTNCAFRTYFNASHTYQIMLKWVQRIKMCNTIRIANKYQVKRMHNAWEPNEFRTNPIQRIAILL